MSADVQADVKRVLMQMSQKLKKEKTKNLSLKKKIKKLEENVRTLKLDLFSANTDIDEVSRKVFANTNSSHKDNFNLSMNVLDKGHDEASKYHAQHHDNILQSGIDWARDNEMETYALDDDEVNRKCFYRFRKWLGRHAPMSRRLKKISAQYGVSSGAYFKFLRWLFINSIIYFVFSFIFLIWHIANLSNLGAIQSKTNDIPVEDISDAGNVLFGYRWKPLYFGHFINLLFPRFMMISSFIPPAAFVAKSCNRTGLNATNPLCISDELLIREDFMLALFYVFMIILIIVLTAINCIWEDYHAKKLLIRETTSGSKRNTR